MDKLKVLFKEPGWQPDYLGGPILPHEVKADYKVYDPHIYKTLNVYVFFQFLVLLGGTSLFLFLYEAVGWPVQLMNVIYIFVFSVTMGGIMENKKWMFGAEILRILLLPVVVYISFLGSDMIHMAFISSLTVAAGSLIWFLTNSKRSSVRFEATET